MTKNIKYNIVKVPRPTPYVDIPIAFPPLGRLYLELLENKDKVKKELVNSEYIPKSPGPQNIDRAEPTNSQREDHTDKDVPSAEPVSEDWANKYTRPREELVDKPNEEGRHERPRNYNDIDEDFIRDRDRHRDDDRRDGDRRRDDDRRGKYRDDDRRDEDRHRDDDRREKYRERDDRRDRDEDRHRDDDRREKYRERDDRRERDEDRHRDDDRRDRDEDRRERDDFDESEKSTYSDSDSGDELSNRLKRLLEESDTEKVERHREDRGRDREDRHREDRGRDREDRHREDRGREDRHREDTLPKEDKYSVKRDEKFSRQSRPPTLAEIEAAGHHRINREGELPDITHGERSAREDEERKREMIFKFELLKKSYRGSEIPTFTVHSDLTTMERTYESTLRSLSLETSVESYKKYLTMAFMGIEFALGNFLKFDMEGFTQQQILSMSSYERLLLEMGEKSYVPGGSKFPVEIRLLFLVLMNTAFFLFGKMISKKTGFNPVNMMSKMAAGATSTPQKRRRPMRGPGLDPDELPEA